MEKENLDPIEDLKNIRNMMERSSKFLSLSGLSGIFAGGIALAGAYIANFLINQFNDLYTKNVLLGKIDEAYDALSIQLLLTAIIVFFSAIGLGLLFTYIKAKRNQQKLNHPIAFKVLWSGMIPLLFGGLFTIILYVNNAQNLIGSATLVFYGLALLNASKYLNIEIKYLAISELILGILAGIYIQESLLFWAIGFGILHIFYGAIMYFKYDRQ